MCLIKGIPQSLMKFISKYKVSLKYIMEPSWFHEEKLQTFMEEYVEFSMRIDAEAYKLRKKYILQSIDMLIKLYKHIEYQENRFFKEE